MMETKELGISKRLLDKLGAAEIVFCPGYGGPFVAIYSDLTEPVKSNLILRVENGMEKYNAYLSGEKNIGETK